MHRNRRATCPIVRLLLLVLVILFVTACSRADETTGSSRMQLAAEGRRLFEQNCARCHSLKPGTVIIGPSLAGIASRAGTRLPDLDAQEYIHQSITKPNAHIVDGFSDLMPSDFAKKLSNDQLESVIAYLLTLK